MPEKTPETPETGFILIDVDKHGNELEPDGHDCGAYEGFTDTTTMRNLFFSVRGDFGKQLKRRLADKGIPNAPMEGIRTATHLSELSPEHRRGIHARLSVLLKP